MFQKPDCAVVTSDQGRVKIEGSLPRSFSSFLLLWFIRSLWYRSGRN